jgi:CubicO group peptidase (beta-lactamase class C family)
MRTSRRISCLPALLVAAVAVVSADATDDFVRAEMKRQNIPGLSLAAVKDGVVLKAAGYGVANLRTKSPATPETVYKIASVSKQFIATGIMLLVQEGRVSVDDSVRKLIPGAPAAWNRITIRHLLTHTAGLVREPPAFSPFKADTDAALIESAYETPLRFTPGDKWEYSNLGYVILAEVISRVSGKPWSDFISERVFQPAGMAATRTTTPEPIVDRAAGYSDNDKLIDAPDWPAVRAGGAFLSTVLDLARWDAVLRTNSILTEASRAQMWTPARLNGGTPSLYGFGWHVNRPGARRQVWHSGGLPGFKAQYRRYLDDGVTVVILMNLDDADDERIAAGVAERYLSDRR